MLLLFILLCGTGLAQNPLHTRILELIRTQYPNISTTDKLIAYNAWGLEDQQGRDRNQSFDKAVSIYANARLKGGLKGLLVVSLCTDAAKGIAATVLEADGIARLLVLDKNDLGEIFAGAPRNMVFDASGAEVYRNLDAGEVLTSINKLITR